jgi:hypothetical protein
MIAVGVDTHKERHYAVALDLYAAGADDSSSPVAIASYVRRLATLSARLRRQSTERDRTKDELGIGEERDRCRDSEDTRFAVGAQL